MNFKSFKSHQSTEFTKSVLIALIAALTLSSCDKPLTSQSQVDDCIVDNENICTMLKEEADKANADLPKNIDNVTYVSVVANKKELTHTYETHISLKDAAANTQMTTDQLALNQQILVQKLACEDEAIRTFINKGIVITYVYQFTDTTIQFSLTTCPVNTSLKK